VDCLTHFSPGVDTPSYKDVAPPELYYQGEFVCLPASFPIFIGAGSLARLWRTKNNQLNLLRINKKIFISIPTQPHPNNPCTV
jgi:hypothetical protein